MRTVRVQMARTPCCNAFGGKARGADGLSVIRYPAGKQR